MTSSSAPPATAGTVVDIVVESSLWDAIPTARETVNRAIAAAAAATSNPGAALAVVLTDDARMRELNRKWRGIDKPTNVLSFPAAASSVRLTFIGDVVVAQETVACEAAAERKSF